MKRPNKIILVLLITISTVVIFFSVYKIFYQDDSAISEKNNKDIEKTIYEPSESNDIDDRAALPQKKLLDIKFIPQAPFHDWEEPWQNACEEAAVLNTYYYLEGKQNISNDQIRDDIQAMVNWQVRYFGQHKDLNIAEVAVVIKQYLGYDYKIIEIKSIDDIKKEIDRGNPIVIPAAGRILQNEHFTQPAPVYHMLTVIGYTQNKIITNDPGTQFGEKLEYSYENIMASIHDWEEGVKEDPDLIVEGEQVGIVLVDS